MPYKNRTINKSNDKESFKEKFDMYNIMYAFYFGKK